ncbi:GatB/YqeY domain-containing protein [Cellulosilyticum ruminicola]|uniref:GatB/YqeY domain-containing protein n=1 Tax=Cellulosilyticum ruminicola TaxID=425254 RepID=UPI0006D1C51D|nr:GatB/YqeY domain-containing protein [Cellulosilyticum ruminicola]
MSLKEQLLSDMKEAMKVKDILRKNTVQSVRGAILQKEKDSHEDVDEEQILDIIMQEIKKRKDALADFEKGNRPDLVADAQAEIAVLQGYLPKQLSEEELSEIIREIIEQVGATSMKDMGKVMGLATAKVKGKADNGKVSSIVKQCLMNQ